MKHAIRRAAIVGWLALMLIPLGLAPAQAAATHSPTVHTVRPGESIQAALDRARHGDTVLVRPGIYRENLELSTDGVTLLGYGATLAAPETPVHRRCSTAVNAAVNGFGVCIAGALEAVPGEPPAVRGFVRDVSVRGLTIGQFPNTGIVALAAVGTRIQHTDVAGGASYGMLLAVDTSESVVTANRVHGGTSAGIYVGDSPQARATVVGNEIFDSGVFGVFVRDASHGTVAGNVIHGNCVGVGFVPTRPDPTAVAHWRVTANRIHDNDGSCALGSPPATAAGVVIAGANDVTVTRNLITGHAPADGASTRGGGVVLLGGEFGGPAEPAGNRVQANVLRDNHPYDLAWLAGGTGNRFSYNVCRTSTPDNLC